MTRVSTASDSTASRLIEAAMDLFAERGYQGASVREICAQADANGAAVNYHFGGKADLYRATVQAISGDIAATWPGKGARLADYPSRDAALDHVLRSLMTPPTSGRRKMAMLRIRDWEIAAPTGLIDDIMRQRIEPALGLIREIVRHEAGTAAGSREESMLVLAVVSLATGHALHAKLWEWFGHTDLMTPESLQRLMRLVKGLINGGLPGVAASG